MVDWWLSVFAPFVMFCPPIALCFFTPLAPQNPPKGAIPPTLRTTGLE